MPESNSYSKQKKKNNNGQIYLRKKKDEMTFTQLRFAEDLCEDRSDQ